MFLLILPYYIVNPPSINLPVIPTFRDIANLIECVAMFCFVKRLLAFRIMTDHAPTATIIMDL